MNAHIKALETPFTMEEPQPLLWEPPAGAPYPVAALGPLKAVVEAVQGMTLAPVAIAAQSALAVASLAVQGFANVEALGGPVPLSLYCLTIARSGERKTTCDAILMAPLRAHEQERAKAHRAERVRWENEHALWKARRDALLSQAKGKNGERSIEAQVDLEALGPEPAPPPSPERVVTEPTFEGLTRLYAQGQSALGIFSDEGGQFLGGHAMSRDNRQKTLAALNDLWSGNPIRRTRQGDGSITLYERRLAVHLMVQPGVARAFMSDPMAADTGFLPRFLSCEPPSTIGTRLNNRRREDPGAIDGFGMRLRNVLATPLPMEPDTRELRVRVLPLAPDARALLVQFSDAIEREQAPGRDLAQVTGYASKAAEQAARIAAVLTLWNDLEADQVSAREMADAITLTQFYLSEAVRLADAAVVSAEIAKAEDLRRWLVEKWPHAEVVLADVLQFGPNALRASPTARAAVKLLEQHGWLIPLEEGTDVRGMRRNKAWRIVRTDYVV